MTASLLRLRLLRLEFDANGRELGAEEPDHRTVEARQRPKPSTPVVSTHPISVSAISTESGGKIEASSGVTLNCLNP